MNRKAAYPTKTSMNLFYKPDRTTRPTTVALYVLFAVVCLLALAKLLVYDLWIQNRDAQRDLATAQERLNSAMLELSDYNEVRQDYFRYSATDEERALVDRMEVLAMLDGALANTDVNSISIKDSEVQLELANVTLAQSAEIVSRLEAAPLVASTTVNTATSGSGDRKEAKTTIIVQLQTEEAEEG